MATLKNYKWMAFLLTGLFLLASCSTDDLIGGQPDAPAAMGDIVFSIGFAGQSSGGGAQMRAATAPDFTSAWENGDQIGIFAVASGNPLAASGNYIHNVKLTYSSASGGTWTPSETLWWKSGVVGMDFYAYYPYDAAATNPTAVTFNVKTDQRGTTP